MEYINKAYLEILLGRKRISNELIHRLDNKNYVLLKKLKV